MHFVCLACHQVHIVALVFGIYNWLPVLRHRRRQAIFRKIKELPILSWIHSHHDSFLQYV